MEHAKGLFRLQTTLYMMHVQAGSGLYQDQAWHHKMIANDSYTYSGMCMCAYAHHMANAATPSTFPSCCVVGNQTTDPLSHCPAT